MLNWMKVRSTGKGPSDVARTHSMRRSVKLSSSASSSVVVSDSDWAFEEEEGSSSSREGMSSSASFLSVEASGLTNAAPAKEMGIRQMAPAGGWREAAGA